jgi:hypothetical protein
MKDIFTKQANSNIPISEQQGGQIVARGQVQGAIEQIETIKVAKVQNFTKQQQFQAQFTLPSINIGVSCVFSQSVTYFPE